MGERNDLIENEDACYLLVKRGLYYRPDRQGYTGIKEKAGRYTRADGEQLSRSGVSFVHVDEAEEYSPTCNAETKADHLQAVLADRDATIASLSEALAGAEKKGADEKDEAVRMRAVLEVLVMQRDRHFHTAKAWDEARAVLRAYSKDSSDGE